MESVKSRISRSVDNIRIDNYDSGFCISFSVKSGNPVTIFREATDDLCAYWNGFKTMNNEQAKYVTMEEMYRDKIVTNVVSSGNTIYAAPSSEDRDKLPKKKQ